jgi:hypothetical protein
VLGNMGARSRRDNASGLKPLTFLHETLEPVKGSGCAARKRWGRRRMDGNLRSWFGPAKQIALDLPGPSRRRIWNCSSVSTTSAVVVTRADNRGAVVLLAKLPNEAAADTHIVKSRLDTTPPI